jgi:hypothetical protein
MQLIDLSIHVIINFKAQGLLHPLSHRHLIRLNNNLLRKLVSIEWLWIDTILYTLFIILTLLNVFRYHTI